MTKQLCGVIEIKAQGKWVVVGYLRDLFPCYYNLYAIMERYAEPIVGAYASFSTNNLYNPMDDNQEKRRIGLSGMLCINAKEDVLLNLIQDIAKEVSAMKTSSNDHLLFFAAYTLFHSIANLFWYENTRMILWYEF